MGPPGKQGASFVGFFVSVTMWEVVGDTKTCVGIGSCVTDNGEVTPTKYWSITTVTANYSLITLIFPRRLERRQIIVIT